MLLVQNIWPVLCFCHVLCISHTLLLICSICSSTSEQLKYKFLQSPFLVDHPAFRVQRRRRISDNLSPLLMQYLPRSMRILNYPMSTGVFQSVGHTNIEKGLYVFTASKWLKMNFLP